MSGYKPLILPRLFENSVEVTASYEALYNAAEQVRLSSGRINNSCEELRNLNNKLPTFWESDVCDAETAVIQDVLQELEILVERFHQHAVNLKQIAHNYVSASEQVNAVVQGLSSDVIL